MAKPHEPAAPASSDSRPKSDGQTTANATATPEASNSLDLPHERDQQGQTAATPDPKMVQAKKDLDAGLVDTELRNKPGVDAGNMPQGLKHIPKS